MAERALELALDNDFDFEVMAKKRSITTRRRQAATGLSNLRVRFSLTKNGAAIHADLDVGMVEASLKPGTYFVTFDGDVLRARLSGLIGTKIYAVFGDGLNVNTNTLYVVREFRTLG